MVTSRVRGQFIWHELRARDTAAAQAFYGRTVGWKAEPWPARPAHRLFAAPNGPVGGTAESGAGAPGWVSYISTADVAATTEAATRLGGRVETAPTALPNGGCYAVLVDPQGAVFGIHASAAEPPSAPVIGPGEFAWHELATTVAPGIAFGFYGALFDWDDLAEHDMGPQGLYLIFGRNGRQLGGIFHKGAAGRPGPAYWLGYVSVTDLEGAVERARAAHGSVVVPPMEVPGGDRIAQLVDPQGALFALHTAAAHAAQPAKLSTAVRRAPNKKGGAKKRAAKTRAAEKAPRNQRAARGAAADKPAKKRELAHATARKPAKRKTKKRRRR